MSAFLLIFLPIRNVPFLLRIFLFYAISSTIAQLPFESFNSLLRNLLAKDENQFLH